MRKNLFTVFSLICVFVCLLAPVASSNNLNEIKKYFELRDTINLVNLEMKRALNPQTKSPMVSNPEAEQNLTRLLLFLEHRIQEFANTNTPLKYHYIRKLNKQFAEARQLYSNVIVRIRTHQTLGNSNTIAAKPVLAKQAQPDLHKRPYFHPIDLRTLLSPDLMKANGYNAEKLNAYISGESNQKAPKQIKQENPVQVKAVTPKPVKPEEKAVETKPANNQVSKKEIKEVAKVAVEDKEEIKKEVAKKAKTLKEENKPQKEVKEDKPKQTETVKEPNSKSQGKVETASAAVQTEIKQVKKEIASPTKEIALDKKVEAAKSENTKVATASVPLPGKQIIETASAPGKDSRILANKAMRPLAIMIENHRKARPQTGLQEAELVYEIPVEGGITRFMAMFFHVPGVLGPIRSCREYFVDRALEVDALYVHCGGSPKGYAYIKKSKVNSIDEIKYGKPFYRFKKRRAPHNLYSSGKKIINFMKKKVKMELPYKKLPLNYGKTGVVGTKKLDSIKIKYHGNYSVSYKYLKDKKRYQRYMNGKKDSDLHSKKAITPGTVVVQEANMKTVDKAGRQEISFIGSGKIKVLHQGTVLEGAWRKQTPNGYTDFFTVDGKRIIFSNESPVWIQVVSPKHKITLNPDKKGKNTQTKSIKKAKK